jgi:hypothetical protein
MDRNLTIEEEYEEIQNKYIKFFKKIETEVQLVAPVDEVEVPYNSPLEEKEFPVEELVPIPKQICIICKGTYSHFNKKRHDMTRKHLNALQV